MSLLPKIRAKYGEGIGVELLFTFPELYDDQISYLSADCVSGASSLSADGINFSISQFIVIGQPGSIGCEIVQIHANTAPTATTIALAGTTLFAHNRGQAIRFIPYDQIVPERSTDGGVNFSALSAVAIRSDSMETYLQRPADSLTDVYRFRFNNSFSSTLSAYSVSVIGSGFADNTIWSVKMRALGQLGEVKTALINDQFLNDALQEGRRALDQDPRVFRWTFRTKFNSTLGQMLAGQWQINAPADLRDRNTYKNILSLRYGNQNRPITYQDRGRFVQNYLNIVNTTLATSYTSGGTSLVLTSTHNMDAAGILYISGQSVGGLRIPVNYSANNKSTNTLTITPLAVNIASGSQAWQRATFGLPTSFTIDNGVISFDVPIGDQFDGMDVFIDYYSTLPVISTDSQAFDEPYYDLYVPWLKWKIKYLKANGKIEKKGDPDWDDWNDGVLRVIGQETNGQRINFIPDVDGFLSADE